MLRMNLLVAICILTVASLSMGAKILVIAPINDMGHFYLFDKLTSELSGRGHQLTYVSPFHRQEPNSNIVDVLIPDFSQFLLGIEKTSIQPLRETIPFMLVTIPALRSVRMSEQILELPQIQKIVTGSEHFDLIIGESCYEDSILAGFSHKFKAPIVAVSTSRPDTWSRYMVGNPYPSSYVQDAMLAYPARMSFFQRFHNVFLTTIGEINHLVIFSHLNQLVKHHFGGDIPPIEEIITNTSLVLVNYHHTLGLPRPYLPNMIEIGGFHVNAPKKLPQNLESYLNNARHGVIVFSLGSVVQGTFLPKPKIRMLIKTFSRLKQNVVWKYEKDDLPFRSRNVRVEKWLHQSDILAHPNVKLLITAGGLLSTIEAVARGVPMVGIPIFGDHHSNMHLMESAGLGIKMDYDEMTSDSLEHTINRVLTDPMYEENAKYKSQLLMDTPLPPTETAMFWIEHVIRHKGAPHMRSPAQDLSWYELYQIDVYFAIELIVLVICHILYYFIKTAIAWLCCKGRHSAATAGTQQPRAKQD